MTTFKEPCKSRTTGKELDCFDSEHDASSRAETLFYKYDNKLIPYKCVKCNSWHLSPESRQTPSTICAECTDREGSNKALYQTRDAATKRAAIIRNERGLHLEIYECPYNNGWHLTKG